MMDYILIIEEEDIIINEKEFYKNQILSAHQAEYIDLEVIFINFLETENLELEMKERTKHGSVYLPSLLGVCNHSFLGCGIVIEKPKGESLFSIVYNDELNFEQKIDLIYNLVSLCDFINSRGLYFRSISLKNFTYDIKMNKICIDKYPIIKTEATKLMNDDNDLNIAPELIINKKLKESNLNLSEIISDYQIENTWNLGLLIYEILENKHFVFPLHDSRSIIAVLDKISKIDNNFITLNLNCLKYNQYLKNILKKLLKVNPKQRVSLKLIKRMFNKKLILESNTTIDEKEVKKFKVDARESMCLNNTNYFFNESAYPIKMDNSLMDISKEINFNITINNQKFDYNNLKNPSTDMTKTSYRDADKNFAIENKSELNDKEEMIDIIFENPIKRRSSVNLIDDVNNPIHTEFNNKVMLPTCGEINNEGENFILFEEDKNKLKPLEKNLFEITEKLNSITEVEEKKIVFNFNNNNDSSFSILNETINTVIDGSLSNI